MLEQQIEHNILSLQDQFKYLIGNLDAHLHDSFGSETLALQPIRFVNNIEFYKNMNVINFLRDVGVHFRLGNMLSRESVK
jgi:tyrosyl-tRNA synthetase